MPKYYLSNKNIFGSYLIYIIFISSWNSNSLKATLYFSLPEYCELPPEKDIWYTQYYHLKATIFSIFLVVFGFLVGLWVLVKSLLIIFLKWKSHSPRSCASGINRNKKSSSLSSSFNLSGVILKHRNQYSHTFIDRYLHYRFSAAICFEPNRKYNTDTNLFNISIW